MRSKLPFVLPPLVVALGVLVAFTMVKSRKPAETRSQETPPPLVRVIHAEATDYRFEVASQGTVVPRTEITLVSEVAGRAISISPSLVAGGFFEKGDVLLTLDPLDYEAAVERARVILRQAERRLAEEDAQAEVAREEWKRVGEGDPTPLVLREPQVAEARASLASARKSLAQARRDLDRARIQAPFSGRVGEKFVDVGQFVVRGAQVARIYAIDYAEVRLPLSSADLAYLDLPLGYRNSGSPPDPDVALRAEVAGREHTWIGKIVRTEGEIDPRSRLLYAVARVKDPYGTSEDASLAPLSIGLFVNAKIGGRTVNDVLVVPRSALRGEATVLVVDEESRLRIRDVQVLRTEADRVILASGVEPGERICVSPLDAVVDGMRVRTASGGKSPAEPLGRNAR